MVKIEIIKKNNEWNKLTEYQQLVLSGKTCPYCKQKTKLVDSIVIYSVSYGLIYYCGDCNAWVGCNKGTDKALGRLANQELRLLKKEAHAFFDDLWNKSDSYFSRTQAYAWLSEEIGVPLELTHIGYFSPETCQKVIDRCKLLNLKK
jgi:zinc-finger-containing domain